MISLRRLMSPPSWARSDVRSTEPVRTRQLVKLRQQVPVVDIGPAVENDHGSAVSDHAGIQSRAATLLRRALPRDYRADSAELPPGAGLPRGIRDALTNRMAIPMMTAMSHRHTSPYR